jgi:two-component system sensor histidine kinase/response regulator
MNNQRNILVIDDEQGIRKGCLRALEPQGFTVETAATLQEGLQKLEAGTFDLVLLDVMLPDGRGIDMLAPIQHKDPEMITVIITGYATVELAIKAIKLGAYDFISKPFTSDLLLMTVNQGLEKRRLALEAKRLQDIEKQAVELARARDEAEQLTSFKTAYTRLVAHELRAPVSGAQSLLRTLTRGLAGDLNDKQKDILQRVETRLDELLALVNDLLDLAASKTINTDQEMILVNIQPILLQIIDEFSPEAENKGVTLALNIHEQSLIVQASEEGFRKIFGNLISNAIKYTHAGGSVHVEVQKQAKSIIIIISDTGIGIPEKALPKIGEEFFRAENAKDAGKTGTGLGLSIVKQFVDRFNGEISIQSKEKKGTQIIVKLPLAS